MTYNWDQQGSGSNFPGGGGGSFGSDVLSALIRDWEATDAAEQDWYSRQGEATDMMQGGLSDYRTSMEEVRGDYRGQTAGLGNQYRQNIGSIAQGMLGQTDAYNRSLNSSISNNIDKFLGQVGGLYDSNMGAISDYLDVNPQFEAIGKKFGGLSRKAERLSDRALTKGSAWAKKIAGAGEKGKRSLYRLGKNALSDMFASSDDVKQASERIRNRIGKTDAYGERLEQKADEMFGKFEEYSAKVQERAEGRFSKLGRWAEKGVAYLKNARGKAELEINAQIASQSAALSSQFDSAKEGILNSNLPDEVKMQELHRMDREAANAFVTQGAQTQNAATQMKWSMDEGVAGMMMSAGQQELASMEMRVALDNSLTQMGSFVMSQGQPALYAEAGRAYTVGLQAEIAAANTLESVAQIRQAGHALMLDAATKGESIRLQGLEGAARTEIAGIGAANAALQTSIQALNGELQSVFGQAEVLKGAAQLTASANRDMLGAFQHTSNLASQSAFQSNSNSINAVFRAADIRAAAEGSIYGGSMQAEGNIFNAMTHSYEVELGQVNTIAAHHASYKANPVSVADIYFGLMNAEATSYNAFGMSLFDQPGLQELQNLA